MQIEEFQTLENKCEDIWVSFRDILNRFRWTEKEIVKLDAHELSEYHADFYLKTPFSDFNKLANGFGNSHLNILAARPSMGKTSFALNILEHICFEQKLAAGFFSLDMRMEPIVERLICSQAEVECDKLRKNVLSKLEIERIVNSINQMKESKLIIDDTGYLSIFELVERAKLMKEKLDISFLVIDYLQLINIDGPYASRASPYQDTAEIVRMLKYLAQDLQIPILCLSQLGRKVEERAGHRPMMTDLPHTGALEEHADLISFILRREYYDPNDKPGMAEIIIGKNRHGGVGSIQLAFIKELCQFRNYVPYFEANDFADL